VCGQALGPGAPNAFLLLAAALLIGYVLIWLAIRRPR
jgi:hypothetical protein